VKTYIEEFSMTFSGLYQTVFSFLTTYSLKQIFPQTTVTFFTATAYNQTDPNFQEAPVAVVS
jgi:hypothetical protein